MCSVLAKNFSDIYNGTSSSCLSRKLESSSSPRWMPSSVLIQKSRELLFLMLRQIRGILNLIPRRNFYKTLIILLQKYVALLAVEDRLSILEEKKINRVFYGKEHHEKNIIFPVNWKIGAFWMNKVFSHIVICSHKDDLGKQNVKFVNRRLKGFSLPCKIWE